MNKEQAAKEYAQATLEFLKNGGTFNLDRLEQAENVLSDIKNKIKANEKSKRSSKAVR